MIRSEIFVSDIKELYEVYNIISQVPGIEIIRIRDYLDESVENITLNFIYVNAIIGEIQLRYQEKPCYYYSNNFINELIDSKSAEQFQ